MNSALHALCSAFLLVLSSELGDRTFLFTTLLSSSGGGNRGLVYWPAFLALSAVSVLSVGLGRVLLMGGRMGVIGEEWIVIGGGVLLIGVGIWMLIGGAITKHRTTPSRQSLNRSDQQQGGDEASELQKSDSVEEQDQWADSDNINLDNRTNSNDSFLPISPVYAPAASSPHQSTPTPPHTRPNLSAFRIFGLIFTAEWGDRSQLALIALSTTEKDQPAPLLVGAVIGHATCTGIACQFGSLVRRHIDTRTGK